MAYEHTKFDFLSYTFQKRLSRTRKGRLFVSFSPAVSDAANRIFGLAPTGDDGARVLVLGSMPSALSLQHGEYYGNPRNAFWTLMGALFDAGPERAYEQRIRRLSACGVSLWWTASASCLK